MKRFTTSYGSKKVDDGYYSSHYGVNGMIGFIIKKINIDTNIHKIGSFFNTRQVNKLYTSNHSLLKLFHLMMDFSSNIKWH